MTIPLRQPNENSGAPVMDAAAIRNALRRIAHEIIERNSDLSSIVLVGIPSRGIEIANRLANYVQEFAQTKIETGVIDVSMYRDDVGQRAELPIVAKSQLPLPLEGRTVILVDDRGHRELPIRADYAGKNLPTAPGEHVRLRLTNVDNEPDAVWLLKE